MKKVTNSDIGGRGSKIWHFCGDVIFKWPLRGFDNVLKKAFLNFLFLRAYFTIYNYHFITNTRPFLISS